MATQVSVVGSAYAGVADPKIYSLAYVPQSIYSKNIFTIHDRVKLQLQLGTAAFSIVFKDYTDAFSATAGAPSLTYSTLTPVKYEMANEISYTTLYTAWQADMMKPGPWEDYLGTPEMASWVENWIAGKAAVMNEKLYLQGKAVDSTAFTFSGAYAGLVPLLISTSGVRKPKMASSTYSKTVSAVSVATQAVVTMADVTNLSVGDYITFVGFAGAGAANINGKSAQIIDIPSSTTVQVDFDSTAVGTITYATATARFVNTSNVISALVTAFTMTPQAIRSDAGLRVMVSRHIADAYNIKQGLQTTANGLDIASTKPTNALSFELIPMDYFDANTIVVELQTNSHLVCDVVPDDAPLKIKDMGESTLDYFLRYRMTMKSIVGITNPTEFVVFSPLN